ncbi:MAG: hypothetical protein KAG53_05065 [Endozoicomonadaceae bacterium]|nr:hypothetical protein [Endozoicomonadaceae bacterium]
MFKSQTKVLGVMLIIVGLMVGCTQKNYKLTKSSLELQSIQKREFETSYNIAFASVLSVFQDKGYIIETADKSTGLMTATSHKMRKSIMFVGQGIEYVKATAFIETMPSKKNAIRLNFVKHQETSSGQGMRGGNSVPIEKPEVYQEIFEKIHKAIFVRTNH